MTAAVEVPTVRCRPPGLSEADFDAALAALVAAVGPAAVRTGDLSEHADPYAFSTADPSGDDDHDEGDFVPSAVVLPASVEQVQAVVRIAQRHTLPLWTVSRAGTTATAEPLHA